MRSAGIVEAEVPADRGAGLADRVVGPEIDLLVLDRSPEPLDEDVVPPGPLPSMLMTIPALSSTLVKSWLVNCEPWSVLKTSGRPCRASASSSASMQNAASKV